MFFFLIMKRILWSFVAPVAAQQVAPPEEFDLGPQMLPPPPPMEDSIAPVPPAPGLGPLGQDPNTWGPPPAMTMPGGFGRGPPGMPGQFGPPGPRGAPQIPMMTDEQCQRLKTNPHEVQLEVMTGGMVPAGGLNPAAPFIKKFGKCVTARTADLQNDQCSSHLAAGMMGGSLHQNVFMQMMCEKHGVTLKQLHKQTHRSFHKFCQPKCGPTVDKSFAAISCCATEVVGTAYDLFAALAPEPKPSKLTFTGAVFNLTITDLPLWGRTECMRVATPGAEDSYCGAILTEVMHRAFADEHGMVSRASMQKALDNKAEYLASEYACMFNMAMGQCLPGCEKAALEWKAKWGICVRPVLENLRKSMMDGVEIGAKMSGQPDLAAATMMSMGLDINDCGAQFIHPRKGDVRVKRTMFKPMLTSYDQCSAALPETAVYV